MSDPEGHFTVWNLSNYHTTGNVACSIDDVCSPTASLFECDFSYSRAAVDQISADIMRRAVPLRSLRFWFIKSLCKSGHVDWLPTTCTDFIAKNEWPRITSWCRAYRVIEWSVMYTVLLYNNPFDFLTLANVDRFLKFFHRQILEEILHTRMYHKDSPPHLKYVSTLPCETWKFYYSCCRFL